MIPETNIYTYSGVSFSPLSPCEGDIKAEDIAHALSYMCRANGHFRSFYSVAQHCLACVDEAKARGYSRETQLACLLHDASEAFISDITRPVKRQLTEYRGIEKRLQDTIYRRFGLNPEDSRMLSEVSSVDDCMLYHEFLTLGGLALYDAPPEIKSTPCFDFVLFDETEKLYLSTLSELLMED